MRELQLAGTTVEYKGYAHADHASILEQAAADAVTWAKTVAPLA